eukprot:1087161-Pyramimonas_sp.AAC.1
MSLSNQWPSLGDGSPNTYGNFKMQPWRPSTPRADLRQNISQRIALPKLGRDATWCKVCGKFCYNDLLEKFDYTCQYCGCFLKG